MAADPDIFARELLENLLGTAASVAQPEVSKWSRGLAAAMRREIISLTKARLHIPHYWAIYVNDGRGPIKASRTVFLVWFADPSDDPRFPGRLTPERASQVRRLTAEEWKYWRRKNNEAIAAGTQPPMIVARQVGAVRAKRFFNNGPGGGMSTFKEKAQPIVKAAFSKHVRDFLGPKLLNAKSGLTLKLRV